MSRPRKSGAGRSAALRRGAARRRERRVLDGRLRVPSVRRCTIELEQGAVTEGFTINISLVGAYIAAEAMPSLHARVVCRFSLPGNERPIAISGVVAWVNERQQHPVHSLPPGFGLKFDPLSPEDQARVEALMADVALRLPRRG